jgi:biopolymer transport protein ExbD
MVDVVMVILVFFMLGTSFALSEGLLATRLPTQIGPGGGARVAIVPHVRISLVRVPGDDRTAICVLGLPLPEQSFSALRELLAEKLAAGADPLGRVTVSADSEVAYADLVSALDACAQAGMRNVQIAVTGGAAVMDAAPEADD